jgi:hypothetical protein
MPKKARKSACACARISRKYFLECRAKAAKEGKKARRYKEFQNYKKVSLEGFFERK